MLVNVINTEDLSLDKRAGRYWSKIISRSYSFDDRAIGVSIIKKLQLEEFVEFY